MSWRRKSGRSWGRLGMKSDYVWPEIELSSVITDIAAGPFGSNLKVECFVPDGFPIIDGANLKGFKVTDNVTKFVTDEKAHSLERSIAHRGDVVSTISGTLGQIAYIPDDSRFEGYLCSQRQFRISFNKEKVYIPYIVFYFHTYEGQQKILSFASQVGVPALTQPLKNFRKIRMCLPDLETQQKIASVIEEINNKIEINKRINDNLQKQAFSLFFKMISSAACEETELDQIAELNPRRQLAKGSEARYIDMAQLSTSGSFPDGWITKPYNGGIKFINGDTILARITPCLENGKAAFVNFLDDSEIAFGSTEYIVMASRGIYPPEFFYCLARYPSFVDYAVKNMNGTSGRQRVSAEVLGKYCLPLLSQNELEEFMKTVPTVFRIIRNNSLENMRLIELRDTLLPRLMSGEIDVSNIAV